MTVMKRKLTILCFFCLVTCTLVLPVRGQIHRAKPIKSNQAQGTLPGHGPGQLPRFPPSAFNDHDEEVKLADSDPDIDVKSSGHNRETWVYAMISAMLVGLSGIFPLLVIPLETGKNLHHGASGARLKLFLSFAVGGLLGDVFLHLLPEAWAHVHKVGDVHRGHMEIGLWVLAGMFCFLIIEKIFPDDEDDDEQEEEEQEKSLYDKAVTQIDTSKRPTTRSQAKHRKHTKNGHVTSNGHVNGHLVSNGHVTSNGHVMSNGVYYGTKIIGSNKKSDVTEEDSKIKTSGWLNLMANVVDNFTHGLAVAGSYCISTKSGLITTAAVLLHEIPHEIGDFAILLQSGFDRWKAAKAQLLTASGGILGAIAALSSESAEIAGDRTAWILPFTSGGFIYIAMVTVVPNLLKEKNNWESTKQVACILTGITMVAGVTLLCE